jgi:hypothetical protein
LVLKENNEEDRKYENYFVLRKIDLLSVGKPPNQLGNQLAIGKPINSLKSR